jgi:hypothetical protein
MVGPLDPGVVLAQEEVEEAAVLGEGSLPPVPFQIDRAEAVVMVGVLAHLPILAVQYLLAAEVAPERQITVLPQVIILLLWFQVEILGVDMADLHLVLVVVTLQLLELAAVEAGEVAAVQTLKSIQNLLALVEGVGEEGTQETLAILGGLEIQGAQLVLQRITVVPLLLEVLTQLR